EGEIDRIISRLRHFYESQTPNRDIEQWGTPEKLKISTDENFTQVEPFVGRKISPAAFEAIRHFTNEFYVRNEKLFCRRIQQHWIRDCHGDVQLDHIHLTPEATTIFDCIEFNDRFRFIDVANDVAFLAMDFDFEGRSDLGNLLLRNCAREFHDPEMLKLSDFYKCYRALVRAKVETIQATSMKRMKARRGLFPTDDWANLQGAFSTRASCSGNSRRSNRRCDVFQCGKPRIVSSEMRESSCSFSGRGT